MDVPRDDPTEDGPPAPVLVGKARVCAIQLPLHKTTQCPATTPGKKKKKKPGWQGSLRQPAPPSCSPTMDSPRDCRPREEQHPAGCARKGLASGKESATSLPRQGHTWAPQAVAPGQRLAPASLGRLPTHCGGRQLGWSPAQLRGRKLFTRGRGPCWSHPGGSL